ncbi:MAG: F420H2 dehydrogenase subunit FpoO [Methermicoccaceae archaeon]
MRVVDCDLCGRSEPTLVPVRVRVPAYSDPYPEGMWRGLCRRCLECAHEAYTSKEKDFVKGRCDLSFVRGDVVEFSISVPSFSQGTITELRHLSLRVLEECSDTYELDQKGELPPYE